MLFRSTFRFKRGVAYELRVKSEPRQPDVDLFILDRSGQTVMSDNSVGPDSYIKWTPAQDGDYRVEVKNLDHRTAVQSAVSIQEALPPGVYVGKGSVPIKNATKGGAIRTEKFRVKGGHPAKLTSPTPGVSITVLKESDMTQIAAQPANGQTLNFTVPNTEIVIARFRNEGKTAVAISVIYDVGP